MPRFELVLLILEGSRRDTCHGIIWMGSLLLLLLAVVINVNDLNVVQDLPAILDRLSGDPVHPASACNLLVSRVARQKPSFLRSKLQFRTSSVKVKDA